MVKNSDLKVIQIAVSPGWAATVHDEGKRASLYALRSDGKIFCITRECSDKWCEVTDVPGAN